MSSNLEHNLIIPQVKILNVSKGCHWRDGWITHELELLCHTEETAISGFELAIWNPDSSARYAGNKVTVTLDNLHWYTPELAMGESAKLNLAVEIPRECEFRFYIGSAVYMQPDALDSRERGVVITDLIVLFDTNVTAVSNQLTETHEPKNKSFMHMKRTGHTKK